MALKLARIYDKQQPDGLRILVDRVWPRGVSKADAQLNIWLKEVGPTTALRKWFHHEPQRFETFKEAYIAELQQNATQHAAYQQLAHIVQTAEQDVILLYAAKDTTYNHVVILRECLEKDMIKAQ